MDTPTKRVGIWIRVSTEDQAKGELKRGAKKGTHLFPPSISF